MRNKTKRAVLAVDEATGKRIRRLSLEEAYPESHEIYLTIAFEDETEVVIEIVCQPCFQITHLARDTHDELEPVKKSSLGPIQSLAERGR